MRKLLFLAGILLTGFSSQAQIEEIRRITETLCSPEFHGRGYVNKGDSIAADYLVSEFKALGCEPFKGDYLQHFAIDQVNTFPGKMSVLRNGVQLDPGIHYVVHPSSPGYQGKLDPAVLTGEQMFDQDAVTEALGGILEGTSGKNALALRLFDLSADSLKELRGITEVLSDFVPVIELVDEKFTWSVGRSQLKNLCLQVNEGGYEGGALVFTVDIEAELQKEYQSQNVMAYIPAQKKCKETIVFTAHYDHLGRMGTEAYFPGGNDNASGTAMLLTMAKYFQENPSEYNILFIAFAGEEAGLLGSKYFVENTPIKLKKIRFLLNLDIMGSGEEGITAVNATLFEEEYNLLNEINTELGLLAKVKRRGPTQNSDHYWFTEQGVPSFFIYTMGTNKNYHDIHDTYENLTFSEYEDITKLLVKFVDRLD
ncbi:MAG: M20/M25/M40 family metallo-hydrolase [bacterium]|nr:M20/M25/M40 family metallo-hydrolase [bacterium]